MTKNTNNDKSYIIFDDDAPSDSLGSAIPVAGKRPSHIVWQVIGEGDKARWTRVGAGWTNRDGKGLSLKFDAYPVSGRTVVREFADQVEGGQQ